MTDSNQTPASPDLSSSGTISTVPQFSTAEYAHVPGTERCKICNNLIAGEYFRVNGLMACATCASQAHNGQPQDSHVAFTQGLLFGIGAAVAGLIAYAAFTILTGLYIGYIALGVGWLVAKAMKKGAHGLGGRRYQVAAVLLTYAAISLAAIPIGIYYELKHPSPQQHTQASSSTSDAQQSDSQDAQEESAPRRGLGSIAGRLLMLGLASPFLELQDPVHGVIGLVILFVGLRIAWQLTASTPLEVDGPYAPGAIG